MTILYVAGMSMTESGETCRAMACKFGAGARRPVAPSPGAWKASAGHAPISPGAPLIPVAWLGRRHHHHSMRSRQSSVRRQKNIERPAAATSPAAKRPRCCWAQAESTAGCRREAREIFEAAMLRTES